MNDESWQSEEQREIDLILENQALETELALQGGTSYKNGEIDPEIENAFLKNIIAFEEADKEPQIPLRSLFPDDYVFPPVSSMSENEIEQKLDEIAGILSAHNIEFGFVDGLPGRILYKYLAEEYIPRETITAAVSEGFTWHIDGCTGGCDECFQNEYCETGKELREENQAKGDTEAHGRAPE